MRKKVLVTGGAGFIGHHVVAHLLKWTDWKITLLDRLDFSGAQQRIAEIENFERHRQRLYWRYHDLRAPIGGTMASVLGAHDYIIHMAALTHVDRSIEFPLEAVADNVLGTAHILEYARATGCERLVYFSTDEVFGPAPPGVSYKEWDRYKSTNPYSATKAGGEELVGAYVNTYGVPAFTTHTMNVFGERQSFEKFIPSTIRKTLLGETISIHASADRKVSGSRFYIHASVVADAIHFLLGGVGEPGEKYNIVGRYEVSNLEMATRIAVLLDRPLNYEMVDYHSSRPGHDLRYALDGSKMESLGWQEQISLSEALQKTVEWSVRNPRWLGLT